MEVKTILNPSVKIEEEITAFQLKFFGFSKEDLTIHDEKYGSEPFGYVVGYKKGEMVGVLNLIKRDLGL